MAAKERSYERWDLAVVAILFLATFLFLQRGTTGEATIFFQFGPNDYSYLSGFEPHYEVADGVATRWTTYNARVDLPLVLEGGPIKLSYRFTRVFPETAEVEVSLDGHTVDRFTCRGGEILTRQVRLPAVSPAPVSIAFLTDSHERRNLGLRLDWLRIDFGDNARVRLRGWPFWFPPIFSAFLFALFRWGGLSRLRATLAATAWIAVVALLLRSDPFGFAHIAGRIGLLAIFLSALAGGFLRRFPGGRWAIPIFVLGYLLRAGGLFHPETFYPDVANAREYVEAFRETEGSLAERGVETQTRTNVGYPRTVAGKNYAFPYSPLYFLPFGVFTTPGTIEDAVRHVGLTAASFAMLPIFWIALTIFGARTAVLATLLWSFIPPVFSRLLLALHATVVGNFLDLLVVASLLALSLHPKSRRHLALVVAATLASLLVYTSSLFSITALFLFVSILDRRLAPQLLPILVFSGLVTVGWLYWPFLFSFFAEIVPALLGGGGSTSPVAGASVTHVLSRIPLFYGYLYPLLAGFGLFLARQRADPRAFRLLAAYGLAFALMLGMRAFGAGLFKDLKEIVFVAPLVAILAGAGLDALSNRGTWGKFATAVLVVGLAVFGVGRYRGYLETYQSPIMHTMVFLQRKLREPSTHAVWVSRRHPRFSTFTHDLSTTSFSILSGE